MANRIAQCDNGALIDVTAISSINTISEKTGCYTVMFHNNGVYKTMFNPGFVVTDENERSYNYIKGSIYGSFSRDKLVNMWLENIGETPVVEGE